MYQRWSDSFDSTKINYICKFAKNWNEIQQKQYLIESRLYISFALKWVPVLADSDSVIIQIDFQGDTVHDHNSPSFERLKGLNFRPEGNYGKILREKDIIYNNELDSLYNDNGFRIFTYSIRLDSLYAPTSNTNQTLLGGMFAMQHVVPIIKWKQNLAVSIDYIEYEDTIHRRIRTYPEILTWWLSPRLDYHTTLPNSNIISYAGLDELYPGNYDACRIVDKYIARSGSSAIRPLVTVHNEWMDCKKQNTEYFSNTRLFNHYADPAIQCPNSYQLNYRTNFNDSGNDYFIQNVLDRTADEWRIAQEEHLPFWAVTQAWGTWDLGAQQWTGRMLPSPLTQKCLQFLPLCYGASGVINFSVATGSNETVGLIDPNMVQTDNYNTIQTANAKLQVYGPIIKQTSWYGAECIMADTTPLQDFPVGTQHFTNISNYHDQNDAGPYYGYIQCGFFHSGMENYYMMVNRRTDKFVDNTVFHYPYQTPAGSYCLSYYPTDSQIVSFSMLNNGSLTSEYGSAQGLYDPFTQDIQPFNNGEVKISIAAGDASLRQIVAVLPTNVTTVDSLNHDVYAIDDATIHHDGKVIIPEGKTLYLYPNKKIYVTNNAILRIRGHLEAENSAEIIVESGSTLEIFGTMTAGDSTRITLESGSTLDLKNAVCKWGIGAGIVADSSSIVLYNSVMMENDEPNTWNGISCTDGNVLYTNHSHIEGADIAVDLHNSTMTFVSGTIVVPANGTGIKITEGSTNKLISISGSVSDSTLIYSTGTGNNRSELGIDYHLSANHLLIDHTVFRNLYQGIAYSSTVAHADSITDCNIEGCNYGIGIEGVHGLNTISNCHFLSNTNGLQTSSYQPDINNCSFIGGESAFCSASACGISLEYLTGNPHSSRIGDINGCSFANMTTGIYCREASSRICTSNFGLNDKGIINIGSSFMNLSSNARNFFDNSVANITLSSDEDDIQLKWGHNQFYQEPGGYDFWYGIMRENPNAPVTPFIVINANGNYWSDNEVNTYIESNNTNFSPHVVDACMDPHQVNYESSPYYPDRFDNAAAFEDSCSYLNASDAFRDILSDRLEEEVSYWGSCVDRSFKNAVWGEMDLYGLLSYFDAQIDQTPDSLSNLKLLIRDYQAKTYIQLEDYQSAADLIELVLEDPESEVDSLNAVLDLEICYLLASLGESKKPVVTNFTQYRYPDLKTYTSKHREHMLQLMALLNKKDDNVPVPYKLFLGRNYPNPFNPTTTIEFGVSKTTKVTIKIFNIRGQLVKELVNQKYEPGKYKAVWEGKNSYGKTVATGVYFYRLEAAGKCFTHKMLMLK